MTVRPVLKIDYYYHGSDHGGGNARQHKAHRSLRLVSRHSIRYQRESRQAWRARLRHLTTNRRAFHVPRRQPACRPRPPCEANQSYPSASFVRPTLIDPWRRTLFSTMPAILSSPTEPARKFDSPEELPWSLGCSSSGRLTRKCLPASQQRQKTWTFSLEMESCSCASEDTESKGRLRDGKIHPRTPFSTMSSFALKKESLMRSLKTCNYANPHKISNPSTSFAWTPKIILTKRP